MFTTQTMISNGLAGAALLLATPAMARPVATLTVDNQWSAPVTVEIDGHRVDTLHGNRVESYAVRPGMHTVTVRAKNGTLLESETHWLRPHRNGFVTVDIPRTTLTVTNTGDRPMFVSGIAATTWESGGLWVAPGRSHTASVPAGNVMLTGSVEGRRGLQTIDEQTIWAEPGRTNHATMGFVATPTQLVVTNPEPFPVQLFVDGVAHGTLRPGASIALDVRPGRHDIDAVHHRGRVVFDETVRLAHGTRTVVSLCGRITTRSPGAARPNRPGPPPRPASTALAIPASDGPAYASSGYTYWTR
jgi:hypothetical protein